MTDTNDQTKIEFFHTHVSPLAIERVTDVLKSGWLNEGAVTKEFEEKLAQTLRVSNPVTVNSGTSALHLPLVTLGIKEGDEVVIPPQTFVATGLVVKMVGATPVFADIDPNTGNMLPESFESKITERTKAVIPVHWGGYPCEMDEINEIASRHGIAVIEDAAHALGATYKGKAIGSISRFTAFSFQAIKHMTTGDGGMICCPDPADAKKVTVGRWFGIDRENSTRSHLGGRGYDIAEVGYKYHLNNVASAIGIGNLSDFLPRLERRREIGRFYRTRLQDVSGLQMLDFKDDREHAFWLFTIKVERRDDFARMMAAADIPVSIVDFRIDKYSVFGGMSDLPNQAQFNEVQISIPLHEALTEDQLERIVSTIHSGW
jgi:perosamine synthetase